MPVTVTCDYCGGETEKWRAEVERSENSYCSPECSTKAQVKGDPEREYRCDYCGEEVTRSPSQIDRYTGGVYCGEQCFGEDKRDDSNPIDVACAGCGETFTIPEARVGFDNFFSATCRDEHGVSCPRCERDGFKSKQGMKMHYTRVHGDRYDVARLEDKYGVPVPWLLRTLHWTLDLPVYQVADRLDVGRDWVKARLRENGDGHRTVGGYKHDENTPIRTPDGTAPEPLINAIRHALSDRSWPRRSKAVRSRSVECERCGASSKETTLHIHHIIPIRYGGTNGDWNLMALCGRCHANVEGYTVDVIQSVL